MKKILLAALICLPGVSNAASSIDFHPSSVTITGQFYASSITVSGLIDAPYGVKYGDGKTQTKAFIPTIISTAPESAPSVASTTNIYVATQTVTLAGGRPALVLAFLGISNAGGQARTYTIGIKNNGSILDDEHSVTNSGSGATTALTIPLVIDSTTAGSNTFSIYIRSSNAAGTQTLTDLHLTILEH